MKNINMHLHKTFTFYNFVATHKKFDMTVKTCLQTLYETHMYLKYQYSNNAITWNHDLIVGNKALQTGKY